MSHREDGEAGNKKKARLVDPRDRKNQTHLPKWELGSKRKKGSFGGECPIRQSNSFPPGSHPGRKESKEESDVLSGSENVLLRRRRKRLVVLRGRFLWAHHNSQITMLGAEVFREAELNRRGANAKGGEL